MNIVQLFLNTIFRRNKEIPGRIIKGAPERIYKKLSPVLERVLEGEEKALGYCSLVQFQYESFFFDIFNPVFSAVANIFRVWTAKKEMLIATDRRLLLLKLTLLNSYGKEAKEILYESIRSSVLLNSRLTGTIKIKLILKDNTAVLLGAARNQPLKQIHDMIKGRIKPESSPSAQQVFEHHRSCCRCGFVYNAGDSACPACGFKRLSPALACLVSLVFPGVGQLYVGQIILGAIFISYQIVTLCFAYVYIYQWIGRLHEIACIIAGQIVLNIMDSMVKAYVAAKELNA